MDKKVPEKNSNSQNVNYTITSCQRGTSQGSYRIFLEDGSSFFLSIDFFIANKLAKGVVISQELLEEIKKESLFVEAYIKGISLLSRHMYTRYNLKLKLTEKKYDLYGINRALDYLEKQGYINDDVYATSWIQSRIRNKLDSYPVLYNSLVKKGVSSDIVKNILSRLYTNEQENIIIEESIKKFRRQGKNSDDIINKLQRKGFNINKLLFVINNMENE